MSPLLFGGDYNPEQWPRETWDEDIALMREVGVNTVSIGVFSWALLEPREGQYDWKWLDDVVGRLDAGGIGFILATPTASPPPWFTLSHPDAMPVTADGVRLSHGSRDTYAISAPAYRQAASRIAAELAGRYGAHRGLRAWHVHNEYGTVDHGPHAAAAFRRWLQRRHQTLEALNAAWYTSFWSQHYGSWDEVLPPVATQYVHNPALVLDFRRFVSDEMLECLREQATVIRDAGSTAPITTNFMLPSWNHLEHWSWSAEVDLVSIDHYLDSTGPDGEAHAAYGGDLARSFAGGRPWLLMESGTISLSMPQHRPHKSVSRMIRNSLSAIARGSDSALFFQWRAAAAGSEAWHGGLVPHVGTDSRAFRGVRELGALLSSLADVAVPPEHGPVVEADIAILWHADAWWSLESPQLPSSRLHYPDLLREVHRRLWAAGYATDFAAPDADLSRYRLVLVPAMPAVVAPVVENLDRYVHDGGHLAVWFLTGSTDENLHVVPGGYPGRLRDLLGIRVEELHPLGAGETVAVDGLGTGVLWSEYLHAPDAQVVHRYGPTRGTDGSAGRHDGDSDLVGRPAVTSREHGRGRAHYCSTWLEGRELSTYLDDLCRGSGARTTLPDPVPDGVEVVRRRSGDGTYLFVLNHAPAPVVVEGDGLDLVSGDRIGSGLPVAAGGWAVIHEGDGPPARISAPVATGG